jgi:hypothetical protein
VKSREAPRVAYNWVELVNDLSQNIPTIPKDAQKKKNGSEMRKPENDTTNPA